MAAMTSCENALLLFGIGPVSEASYLCVMRNLATLETRTELESKCISQLYLGSLLGTRQSAIGQLGGLSVRRDLNTGRTS